MQKLGAKDIISLIQEYPEFRPQQLADILMALHDRLDQQRIDADRYPTLHGYYPYYHEMNIILRAYKSMVDWLELIS